MLCIGYSCHISSLEKNLWSSLSCCLWLQCGNSPRTGLHWGNECRFLSYQRISNSKRFFFWELSNLPTSFSSWNNRQRLSHNVEWMYLHHRREPTVTTKRIIQTGFKNMWQMAKTIFFPRSSTSTTHSGQWWEKTLFNWRFSSPIRFFCQYPFTWHIMLYSQNRQMGI